MPNPDCENELWGSNVFPMKTHLYTPDSAAGFNRPEEENSKTLRRSPFLYSAALRFRREVIRLHRENEAEGTRVHYRRALSSEF